MSQRMDSAQSQRLKSAMSRNSENESIHFNLSVKTKGSRNPYKIGKVDSLMYSQQSDFGFHPNSPNKIRGGNEHSDSGRSVLQKGDDIINNSKHLNTA